MVPAGDDVVIGVDGGAADRVAMTVPTSVLGPLLLMLEQEIAARVMVPLTEKLPAASAPVTLRVPGIKQFPAVSIRKRVAPALLSRR